MKTYTSVRSVFSLYREVTDLYRIHNDNLPSRVSEFIATMRACEQRVQAHAGLTLEGKDVLIIGSGQRFGETTYFGLKNRTTAIDLDVIVQKFSLPGYLKMLRQNGPVRTFKTLGRKCLRLDARSEREMRRQFGVSQLPQVRLLQMDAAQTTFPDDSFDFVYSFSVFEHFPEPETVLKEIRRVLRPGGVCYTSLHSYTSDSGCHDLRIWSNSDRPPFWAHLRPEHTHKVEPNAYLNKIRLSDWKALFQRYAPDVRFDHQGYHASYERMLRGELEKLRAAGELAEYTDEELLSLNLISIWQKPARDGD